MKKVKINNKIKGDQVPLYGPKGQLIGIIKGELAFNNVRLQIKRNKLEGYYIVWKGIIHRISSGGSVSNWPSDLFIT